MTTEAIASVAKMLEVLPADTQNRVVEHLREYIEDLQDELRWDGLFNRSERQLIDAAKPRSKPLLAAWKTRGGRHTPRSHTRITNQNDQNHSNPGGMVCRVLKRR